MWLKSALSLQNKSVKSNMCKLPYALLMHFGVRQSVWPDCAIYCTLGNFSKPVATIIMPKSPTFLVNFDREFIFVPLFKWNHFCATFIEIWRLFTGHTPANREKIGPLLCWLSKKFRWFLEGFNLISIDSYQNERSARHPVWPDWAIF